MKTSKGYAPMHYIVAIGHSGEYSDAGDQEAVIAMANALCDHFDVDPLYVPLSVPF